MDEECAHSAATGLYDWTFLLLLNSPLSVGPRFRVRLVVRAGPVRVQCFRCDWSCPGPGSDIIRVMKNVSPPFKFKLVFAGRPVARPGRWHCGRPLVRPASDSETRLHAPAVSSPETSGIRLRGPAHRRDRGQERRAAHRSLHRRRPDVVHAHATNAAASPTSRLLLAVAP
jgi:hypothetical protein